MFWVQQNILLSQGTKLWNHCLLKCLQIKHNLYWYWYSTLLWHGMIVLKKFLLSPTPYNVYGEGCMINVYVVAEPIRLSCTSSLHHQFWSTTYLNFIVRIETLDVIMQVVYITKYFWPYGQFKATRLLHSKKPKYKNLTWIKEMRQLAAMVCCWLRFERRHL